MKNFLNLKSSLELSTSQLKSINGGDAPSDCDEYWNGQIPCGEWPRECKTNGVCQPGL